MIKILLVDDNIERVRELVACINTDLCSIKYVTTKNEALCEFEKTQYDLAIIDVMLPENLSSMNPSKTGGIDLIKDLPKRPKIKVPINIVGITSHDEMFQENSMFFDECVIPIFVWINGEDECKKKILNKINYIILTKKNTPPKVDAAIITAVTEEFESVQASFGNGQIVKVENDPQTYHMVELADKNGEKHTILLAMLPTMGLTAAANTTTKIINKFSPDKIFMVGICGGIKGEVELGDVVVASSTWDYGSGKIKPKKEGESCYYTFEPSPNQISIIPETLDGLKLASNDIIRKITESWNQIHKPEIISPKVKFGPMPSGASVICDSVLFDEIVKPQHRKCLGLDMETYGVYYATQYSSAKPILFLSIKAVSDYADIEKNDDYHERCCYFTANFLKECIIECIL